MEKNRKILCSICLLGLVALSLGACEDGSIDESDLPPSVDVSTDEDEVIDETTHVSGVSFVDAKDHYLMLIGETLTLNAEVLPLDADDQSLVWSIDPASGYDVEDLDDDSEDEDDEPKVDVVDDDGSGEPMIEPELETDSATLNNGSIELVAHGNEATITSLAAGLTKITVTSVDGGFSATTEIHVAGEEEIISNYTVNFDLAEDIEVPSYGELWLAVDGKEGFFTLSLNDNGYYSADIGLEAIGESFTYHLYLVYNSHYRELENCPQYTTELEVETLYGSTLIDESYSGNEVTDTIISMPYLPAPEGTYDEINIELTIYSDDGCHTPTVIPETIDVYLEWSNDSWETTHKAYVNSDGLLTRVEGTTSTFTFTFSEEELVSSLGTIEYEIFYEIATEKIETIESSEDGDDENPEQESEKVEISHEYSGGTGSFQVPYFYDQSLTVSFCDHDKGARADDYYFGVDFYVLFVDTSGYSLESLVTKNDVSSEYDPLMYVVTSKNESFISEDITYGDTCIGYSAKFVLSDNTYNGNGCIYCDGSARHISGESDTFSVVFSSETYLTFSTGEITISEKTDEEKDLVYICYVDFSSGVSSDGTWMEVSSYLDLFSAITIEEDDPYLEGNGN